MKSVRIIQVCIIVLFHYINGQIPEPCKLENGTEGQCVLLKYCPKAQRMIKKRLHPLICGFQQLDPIVCCDTRNRIPGEISQRKCKDIYSTTIYSESQNLEPIRMSRRKHEGAVTNTFNEPDPFRYNGTVGGDPAPAMKYPHMALLGYGDYPNITWACGGSLISAKFVISAAHCAYTTRFGPIKYVRLGELDLNSTVDIADPRDIKVSGIIKYPLYKPPSTYHDIVLIELDAPVVYSDFIKPACLQTERNITDPVWIATGWGLTSAGGSPSPQLQEVILKESVYAICEPTYKHTSKRILKNGLDDDIQLCAGDYEKDTCQGDSGGPLQIKSGYPTGYQVIGITSFGISCGVGNTPAVYTRLSYYIDWIESIVWS